MINALHDYLLLEEMKHSGRNSGWMQCEVSPPWESSPRGCTATVLGHLNVKARCRERSINPNNAEKTPAKNLQAWKLTCFFPQTVSVGLIRAIPPSHKGCFAQPLSMALSFLPHSIIIIILKRSLAACWEPNQPQRTVVGGKEMRSISLETHKQPPDYESLGQTL